MNLLTRLRRALNDEDDPLAAYRARVSIRLSTVGTVALMPFALLHLAAGRWVMALVNFGLAFVLLANLYTLKRGREAAVPYWLLSVLGTGGVWVSIQLQGAQGVLWTYPALFMFFFVLPRRLALLLGSVLVLGASASAVSAMGVPGAARVLASLAITLTMIHVVLNVVGELQKTLVAQAITDPLTGAFNRRHLQTHLAQLLVPAGAPMPNDSLLIIDVDHFKRINDNRGHDAGDEVLRRLVATIAARKRRSDMLFRTGGEEFVLLLPRAPLPAAEHAAEELRQRLSAAELLEGERITVSIGVAALQAGQSAEAWMKHADNALYQAKHAGRNRVCVAPLPRRPEPSMAVPV